MNRLSKLSVVLATVSMLTVPAFAGDVLGDIGGFDTFIAATGLLAFGFFLQKLSKK